MSNATCSNCDAPLSGRFCSACGQENQDHEPTIRQILADAWEEFVKVDGRVLATLKMLFVAPGKLTQEFFAGRRVRYVTPLKLYLICSAAYFLVANLNSIQFRITQNGVAISEREIQGESGKLILEVFKETVAIFFNNLATIYIVIVPLTALATALLFKGRKRTLLFHLVFVLHVWSALFVVGALVNGVRIPVNFFLFFFLVGFVYMLFAVRRVFAAKWFEATAKALLFSVSTSLLSFLAFLLILLVVTVQKKAGQAFSKPDTPAPVKSTTSPS